jgi:hypothetical protein
LRNSSADHCIFAAAGLSHPRVRGAMIEVTVLPVSRPVKAPVPG